MPRDLPIGNGSLLVNFDMLYQLCDLYWPHVGQENHTGGHTFHFGVWVEGLFHWISDDGWQRELRYQDDTLLTRVSLSHAELGLSLDCRDGVDFHENLYLREITVHNLTDRAREVRLFFGQDFHISGTDIGDSAYYEPERLAVFHYKGRRWFLINTARESTDGWELGVNQWAVGLKEMPHMEGTWRDAEDGELSGYAVAQGSVDSCVALHLLLPAGGQATGWYWIAAGDSFEEVTRINRIIRQRSPRLFLDRTRHYWLLWLSKEPSFSAAIPQHIADLCRRSLLVMRTQIDNGGAMLASTDYNMARVARDTYCYVWPRDGALISYALVEASYPEVTRRFFNFCHELITDEGYLLHKYNPDGSLASSWLGWYYDGKKELPIQEDETALVIWALWQHFQRYRDVEFIKPLYRGFVIRAANWMSSFRDEQTGLLLPSWDLWEERRGVHAWTVGAVWGGLQAAARFADAFGEQDLAVMYRRVAEQLKSAVDTRLWDDRLQRFRRNTGTDEAVDASLAGLWLFGMYPPGDERIRTTMRAIRERLWVNTDIGGLARYENDWYQRVYQDTQVVPGNPWFISTLWWAHWLAETAVNEGDLSEVRQLLDWVNARALPSGIMAEQLHPLTGLPLSVSPLTWSHAAFVTTTWAYERAVKRVAGN